MKFDALYSARRYWITGIVLAFVGVVVARVIAPGLPGKLPHAGALAGQLLALAGLAVIVIGIRKRVRVASAALRQEEEKT